MAIIELYNTHKILPLAARLDAAEGALHYLTAPWWRRRLWDAKIIGAKVHNWVHKWLERRGIHLYTCAPRTRRPRSLPEAGLWPQPVRGSFASTGSIMETPPAFSRLALLPCSILGDSVLPSGPRGSLGAGGLGGGQPLPGDLRSWNSEKERMQLRRQQLRDAAWIHI